MNLLALLLTVAVPASALFGIGGKKKEDGPSRREAEKESLPGMGGSPETSGPPRMAQEAAASPEGPAQPAPAPAPSKGDTAVGDHPSPDGALPTEVVIRGDGSGKLKNQKPALDIQMDPFESIRATLEPDQQLLLAESPLTVVWRRTHPEFLKHPRVVQPWLLAFSEKPGIVFRPRDQLAEVLQRKVDDKEAKGFQWSLTVADEEGKVFQHYEGASNPPAEVLWSGQSDQGEWMHAGRAYSPVYMFTDSGGTPYTRVGKPIRLTAVEHQERTGMHLTLDSSALFGRNKSSSQVEPEGTPLLRAAADLIKRRYAGVPIRVEAHAGSEMLATSQASAVRDYLVKELMLQPAEISTDEAAASFSDQRLEIVLLNR